MDKLKNWQFLALVAVVAVVAYWGPQIYFDWRFLHQARIAADIQAQLPRR